MDQKNATRSCADCPLCRFTRSRKKESIFYNMARRVQHKCPVCAGANRLSGKDMQKSNFF